MEQFLRLIVIVALSSGLASCGLRYIDAPPITIEDRWIKDGHSKNDIYRAVIACGYDRATRNNDQQISVDKCMLSRGFIFVDSPYDQQGAICKYADYQHLPSCQSLKNEKK
jgi:hypothetical protein